MAQNEIRVLLVDDNEDMTLALGGLIDAETDMRSVGVLGTADRLVAEASRLRPHVVLLDLAMPGRSPLAALRDLRVALPDCRVVVVTGSEDPHAIDEAIMAGASEVLSKACDPAEILGSVRRAAGARLGNSAPAAARGERNRSCRQ